MFEKLLLFFKKISKQKKKVIPSKHTIEGDPKVELLAFAREKQFEKVGLQVLQKWMFEEAIPNVDTHLVDCLLGHGLPVDTTDNNSRTPLFCLVEQNIDVTNPDKAAKKIALIRKLCRLNGTVINRLDNKDRHMLSFPCFRTTEFDIQIANVLLEFGANLLMTLKISDDIYQTLYQHVSEYVTRKDIKECIAQKYQQQIAVSRRKYKRMRAILPNKNASSPNLATSDCKRKDEILNDKLPFQTKLANYK
ncbi:hypothetical protein RFI_00291 [Reticulomyxa filosa]|uniref:Uncharacterized protein n=1 Tax=Reticulomyxa filosa TaxID=46433 RepID=X6PEZ1_RETFI|nr:hypothetical protein RFI_00291 [Reticulomyxa filosa]|eukprot:ETO36771.1 hypothetical protein RFI_00291 [Reticulomyxa filosa]